MLYDILVIILVVYAVFSPWLLYKGIKIGMTISGNEPKEDEKPFKLPKRKKKPKISDEQKRYLTMLDNISAYDGTSNGQRKINE